MSIHKVIYKWKCGIKCYIQTIEVYEKAKLLNEVPILWIKFVIIYLLTGCKGSCSNVYSQTSSLLYKQPTGKYFCMFPMLSVNNYFVTSVANCNTNKDNEGIETVAGG